MRALRSARSRSVARGVRYRRDVERQRELLENRPLPAAVDRSRVRVDHRCGLLVATARPGGRHGKRDALERRDASDRHDIRPRPTSHGRSAGPERRSRGDGAGARSDDLELRRRQTARPRVAASVTAVALSEDGRRIAAAADNGSATVWDVGSGRRLSTCSVGTKPLLSVAFDSTGSRVLVGSSSSEIRICSATTGRVQDTLPWHHSAVAGAAFSSDGRWIGTAGPATAGLGEPKSTVALFLLPAHGERFTAVSWSPTGYRMVAGDEGGAVLTYDCRVCGAVPRLLSLGEKRLRTLSAR